jgi:uncharacterized protein YjbI with pentapeptide repeats
MAGISTNTSRQRAEDASEQTLAAWANFDPELWLTQEIGISESTILEHMADAGDASAIRSRFQNNIQPGKTAAQTAVNHLRGQTYDGINPARLVKGEPLAGIPLSLYVEGTSGNYNTAGTFDVPTFRAAKFDGLSLPYVFVPHAQWYGCDFLGSQFQGGVWDYSELWDCNIVGCTFRTAALRISAHKCRFVNSDFRDVELQDKTVFETECTDCYFENCDFTRLTALAVDFRRCKFRDCNFEEYDAYDAGVNLANGNSANNDYLRCVFDRAHLQLSLDAASAILHCSLVGSTLEGVIVTFDVQGCDLTGATIESPEFNGVLRDNSFRYATFQTGITLNNVDIRGTDFTGSNLDSHLTRAQVRTAASAYDHTTRWIDGSPL